MFKKFLIIGSKSDPASRNIIMNLMDLGKFNYSIIDEDMLKTENLHLNKISEFDYVIFASKHKSQKNEKTLSIHAPGNWREVWGGGEQNRICPASALFQKHLFKILRKEAQDSELKKYIVTLECTHHGPLIGRPCVFIEIGGSVEEWKDRRASFVIAKTIRKAIETWNENKYNEVGIGIGGPHYCPGFNKIQLNSNVAIAHIIPKYIEPINETMILEALNNTVEEVDFAVLDWKGLGKTQDRQKVIDILDKNYISWKKISEISK